VAGSRGRQFCEVHVESVSELSKIQNRSGDRKSVMEMAIHPGHEVLLAYGVSEPDAAE
jgi:hypothetical protein